ncbi:glutamate/aspartate:proton symporter GltP, partial [Stenotrophomonas sp. KAs 5-3]
MGTILSLVPTNIVASMAKGEMLPIIFFSVLFGLGLSSLPAIYFEVITTVAIILGITLANVFQPGAGVDMSQLATVDISKYQSTTEAVQSSSHGIMGTILSLVPTNIVASMAKGE